MSKYLRTGWAIVACILFFPGLSISQTKTLYLKDALQTAEQNYPAIKARMLLTHSAEEKVSEARREYIPALKLHGQVDYATANSLPGTYFPYGIVVPISGAIGPTSDPNATYGSIGLAYMEWAPFSFGQHRARVESAKAQSQVAGADYTNEKFTHLARVAGAYLDYLVFYKLRISQEKNLQRAQALQRVTRASALNGLKPGVDSSFANAEVSKARLSLLDAQKSENIQKSLLADLLGGPEQDFLPDTMSFFSKIPTLPPAAEPTPQNHPLLQYYQAQINASSARETAIMRSYYPKISLLGATWGRGSGISPAKADIKDFTLSGGTDFTRFNYAVGLACTFNIADYPRMRAEANAEQFRTQALRTEEEGARLEISNQQKLATENLNLTILQAKEAPIQLEAATATYRQKLTMYNNGLTNIADLAQSLYNLNRAETDAAISTNAAWKSLLYSAASEGDLNIFTGQF